MNEEQNLIIIKGNDVTQNIRFCENMANKIKVNYYSGKPNEYGRNNVIWLHNPIQINSKMYILYENNLPINGIKNILKFGQDYIKIFFNNGTKKLYRKYELRIEKSMLQKKDVNNCFNYLKELSVEIKQNENSSILDYQYAHMTNISSKSVLYKYLSGRKIYAYNNERKLIFPFGFNLSQKEAVEKAFKNQISIIEGPPGTGKTQTILNIIANALINNETVAVVSNNNSATSNVLEKLKKNDIDFAAAYLGNNENKTEFFKNQNEEYPLISKWNLDNQSIVDIEENLDKERNKLCEMLKLKNELAIYKADLSHWETESRHFSQYNKNSITENLKTMYKLESNDIMNLILDFEETMNKNNHLTLFSKIRFLFKYGIVSFKYYDFSDEIIINDLYSLFYKMKKNEINLKISQIKEKLKNYNFEAEIDLYTFQSMKFLKYKLFKKYSKKEKRELFDKNALKNKFREFLYEYPVILSTTHSIRNCKAENYLFDYVIMDEASQVDLVSGALALSCAKNAVIVGDLKQLPNVVSNNIKKVSDAVFDRYKLKEAYKYSDNSLLASVLKLYEDVPKTLLKEHYRCSPKIIDFCNKKFYNDKLIIMTNENNEEKPLVVYKTSKGNHARNKYNQRQIDVIEKEILPKINNHNSIGIISPYKMQSEELKKFINDKNIQIDTVHKFQGREKDVIILTTVANEINDFIDNENLLNVAISRAVKQLIVVISDNDEMIKNSNLGDLIKYIEYNNLEIINSKVYSVFDLLYSVYSEKLIEFYKTHKRISEYDSENIGSALIDKVIKKEEFNYLRKVFHMPLRKLIKDRSILNEDELRYSMNICTHLDFLLFNKFDKIPVLAVEIDGYAYHQNNAVQMKRDKLKNQILKKINIPLIRLNTNGSMEEEKLVNALNGLINIKAN